MHLLLTGLPGTGKTTLIKKIAFGIPGAVGFYTEEIREKGVRKGFRLVSLSGEEKVLSHVNLKSPHRVGKYRVDVAGFEEFLEGIDFQAAHAIVIDEIGKMECLSRRFQGLINEVLSSAGKTVIATVALRGTPFIEGLKKAPGAELIEVTVQNRDALASEIPTLLHR